MLSLYLLFFFSPSCKATFETPRGEQSRETPAVPCQQLCKPAASETPEILMSKNDRLLASRVIVGDETLCKSWGNVKFSGTDRGVDLGEAQ